MQDPSGRLHVIDREVATSQWQRLRNAYQRAGIQIHLLHPSPGLPDQVFTANPAFVTEDALVAARMRHSGRSGEVAIMADWLAATGRDRIDLDPGLGPFEGGGDLVAAGDTLIGGHGLRSTEAAIRAAAEKLGRDLLPLRLRDHRFYHLDTCLCVLDDQTCLAYLPAFDDAGQAALRGRFDDVLPVEEAEALRFACNAHCADGRHVFLDAACHDTAIQVAAHGFVAVPVETSEFRKSGGSVYCMKQALP